MDLEAAAVADQPQSTLEHPQSVPTTAKAATATGEEAMLSIEEQAALASSMDPLPTPEEIAAAAARASASAAKASSTAATAPDEPPATKGLGKGLGGGGLARRKAKGNGSTISAATAPPALAVRNKQATAGASGEPAGTSGGSVAAGSKAAAGGSSGGSRGMNKRAVGAASFNLNMASDAVDEDEDASGEWESASTDEDISQLLTAAGRAGATAAVSAEIESSVSSAGERSWGQVLHDTFDETTLLVCGAVLGFCAGSVLILGGKAYFSRSG